ncbi:MAG: FAD-binding oxidoreductase [Actinomycetota bacterium]|nr:FAD-binding oxidoreductase [Actinomycetota bacterium]
MRAVAMVTGWDTADVVRRWPGLPALDGDVSADACVVGLGASGLAAVSALVERGLSVVGIDAARVAAGAAGRNGGFLLGGPALFLHVAIARWGEQAAVALYRETLREIDCLEAELGTGVVRRAGSIRLAGLPGAVHSAAEEADRARESADCTAHAEALRTHGIAVEGYEGPLGTGIFLPDDAAINPAARAIAAASTLADRARLHEHTPALGVSPGQVRTARGLVRAGLIIVAVDGGLAELLPVLAPRVRTARLQMLSTRALVGGRLPCPVYGRWGYDYGQQTPDGRLYIGGGRDLYEESEWTARAEPTPAVQRYLEVVAARMAGRPVDVEHRWGASVGFTADARPLCTPVASGVIAVGGYNGTGNLIGPLAARAAVAAGLDAVRPPPYLSR